MFKVIRVVVLTAMVLATPVSAETVQSPLAGVWKLVSWEARNTAGETVRLYGERPSGYYLFAKNGTCVFIMIGDNRSAPASGRPTGEEAIKLLATMSAFDGTYKPEGNNKFVIHVDHAWNQQWTGTDQHREFRIQDNKLSITFTTKDWAGNDLAVTVNSQRDE